MHIIDNNNCSTINYWPRQFDYDVIEYVSFLLLENKQTTQFKFLAFIWTIALEYEDKFVCNSYSEMFGIIFIPNAFVLIH